jgi:hypothetical protein
MEIQPSFILAILLERRMAFCLSSLQDGLKAGFHSVWLAVMTDRMIS